MDRFSPVRTNATRPGLARRMTWVPCARGFRPAARPGVGRLMTWVPCGQNFRPAARPGLAPAGESLLSAGSERSNQEREPNVHVRRGVQRHSARCVHRRRTQTKYCSIRARAPGPGPRSTLRRRNPGHLGAGRVGLADVGETLRRRQLDAEARAGLQPRHAAIAPEVACVAQRRRRVRPAVGAVMQSARCIPVTTPVHGWGSICCQFSGGEHTVPNAVACPGVHERLVLKTFLVPFGVYQKGLACRGETRPGGRAETLNAANAANAANTGSKP
jgi:hypothetical protein